MSKLITEPSVYVVGMTALIPDEIINWAEDHDLKDVLLDPATPLGKIILEADNQESDVSDLDLLIEFAGRHCYRSWSKGRESSEYIENILKELHGSVLEHSTINFAISGVSRALTHELIRHRAGFAISQESQRYVDAADINWVIPPILLEQVNGNVTDPRVIDWVNQNERDLQDYVGLQESLRNYMSENGVDKRTAKKRAAEAARSRLPNAAETRLTWSGNARSLRHFCETRGDQFADLEIRRLAAEITEACRYIMPFTFADMEIQDGDFGVPVVKTQHRKV